MFYAVSCMYVTAAAPCDATIMPNESCSMSCTIPSKGTLPQSLSRFLPTTHHPSLRDAWGCFYWFEVNACQHSVAAPLAGFN